MSEMMLSMNTNFSRLLAMDGRNSVETPPPQSQVAAFSTPPTLPPTSLSPILETTTPLSTPPQIQQEPPSFGKLPVSQLPHLGFPPQPQSLATAKCSQPIYTDSSLTTSQLPNTCQYEQIFQFTNPASHPHLYQPLSPQYPPFPSSNPFHPNYTTPLMRAG
jgi:hypothetical protein